MVGVHPKALFKKAGDLCAFGGLAHLIDNSVDAGSTKVSIREVVDASSDYVASSNYVASSDYMEIQDNGEGMTRDELQKCMSFGIPNKKGKIGKYGYGFCIGTSRLGADTLVFTCSRKRPEIVTIGLLSFTYLKDKKKSYATIPKISYTNGILHDKDSENEDIILHYSPFTNWRHLASKAALLRHNHGTLIVIWNFWNVDGQRELDFDSVENDIWIRNLKKSNPSACINCEHLSSYKYSFKSYASLLYRNISLQIKLLGKKIIYKPIESSLEHLWRFSFSLRSRTSKTKATLIVGIPKCGHRLQYEGMNFYWRNRLIKDFWKFYRSKQIKAGTIGILEADCLKPTVGKQNIKPSCFKSTLRKKLSRYLIKFWKNNPQANPQEIPNERSGANMQESPNERSVGIANPQETPNERGIANPQETPNERGVANPEESPNERSGANPQESHDEDNHNHVQMPNNDQSNYKRMTKKAPAEDLTENENCKSPDGKKRRAREAGKLGSNKKRKTGKRASNEATENENREQERDDKMELQQLQNRLGELTREQEELQKQLGKLTGEQEELQKRLRKLKRPRELTREQEELQKQLGKLTGEQKLIEYKIANIKERGESV